jgi:hypothetical protein
VATHDWATWHLENQPIYATCQSPIGTHARAILPRQFVVSASVLSRHSAMSTADVTHATCHPFSGDTCHLGIGLAVRPYTQICLTHVVSWSYHMSPVRTCHVSVRTCHISVRTDYTDCTVSNFFASLTYRIERDIFSIQSLFDKVNILPKSGRRVRHNGIGFIAFRAL